MSPELNPLLGLLVLGTVLFLIGRALTATSRRKQAMEALAHQLGCEYEARANDAIRHYNGFVSVRSTTKPEVFNLLTRETDGVSLCILDLYYSEMMPLGDRESEVDRKRTIIAISHPDLNLPQFFIRPETGADKLRGMFKSGADAVSQFTEGLEEAPNSPLQGLSIKISQPPSVTEWLNNSEIQLANQDDFNRAYWIQGGDPSAIQAFLTEKITQFIAGATEGNMVWEGFGNTVILGSDYNLLKLSRVPSSIERLQDFVSLALHPTPPRH